MKATLAATITIACTLAYQSPSLADDGGAGIKRLFENQQHETNPTCRLFSNSEAAGYLGKPVKDGHTAAMGTGCQWQPADGSQGSLIVQRASQRDFSPPSGSPKYKDVKGIGDAAFLDYEMGGWQAAAKSGDKMTIVWLTSSKATPQTVLAALRLVLKR